MQWSIGMGQAVVRLSLDKVTWAPLGGFSLLAVREVPQGYSSFFFLIMKIMLVATKRISRNQRSI